MCDWGYCKHNGPPTWGESFPNANGPRQSPIDISSGSCDLDASLKNSPLRFEYTKRAKTVVNTGAGWKVNMNGAGTVLQGGPLTEKYRLEQFHCHWGPNSSVGSEHTVDGNSYPAEIHFVHWNCDKYANFEEAVDKEDGLAVLGVFFTVGKENTELGKITEVLSRIQHKDDSWAIEQDIEISSYIPESQVYWTYPGSLTTPPCLETVTWIVFKDPIEVSEQQLEAFRQLCCYARLDRQPEDEFEGKILANYRPPLEVGDRQVRLCQ